MNGGEGDLFPSEVDLFPAFVRSFLILKDPLSQSTFRSLPEVGRGHGGFGKDHVSLYPGEYFRLVYKVLTHIIHEGIVGLPRYVEVKH